MNKLFDILDDEERRQLKQTAKPQWKSPMLATLTHDHFSDPQWVYERKLDGERCIVHRDRESIKLLSRNRKRLNDTYPQIADELDDQELEAFIIDGEIVAFEGGVTSFSRLQQRMQIKNRKVAEQSRVAVYFYVFDILYAQGHDCTALPLRTRKRLLRRAIAFRGRLRYTPHRNADGEAYLAEACRKGWEGLIAKNANARYTGERSRDWLKFKCARGQELVIVGYTDPQGERQHFGALLLGYYDNGELVGAGKVGTGFDDQTLESLYKKMQPLRRERPPLDRAEKPSKSVHWLEPELVAEVAFTEWTDSGQLRHPRFLGLRRDKAPRDVVRETSGGRS